MQIKFQQLLSHTVEPRDPALDAGESTAVARSQASLLVVEQGIRELWRNQEAG
jgi:hypothetical protein